MKNSEMMGEYGLIMPVWKRAERLPTRLPSVTGRRAAGFRVGLCPAMAFLVFLIIQSLGTGVFGVGDHPARAYASPPPGGAQEGLIQVEAEGSIEYNSQQKLMLAERNVTVTYGTKTVRGDRARFEEGPQKLVVTGDVRMQDTGDRKWTMSCGEAVYLVKEDSLVATGKVSAAMDEASLSGDRLEVDLKSGMARLYGNGRMVYQDITATGDMVIFNREQERAEVVGNARVVSGERIFTGGKITVFLKEKRVVGSDRTRLVIPLTQGKS
ncbi:MAG TPA: LPS export ABC transporter periplasmic protein LptC [Firmicutes bacterium]|nr:LPS export ABC transporter periplasmic protein LptC [Bacillota bacterium]